ncbi:hypothetical protein CO2235_200081 [Cupriavidus oxalaticus]|uniref:Uncharacterized protein n=1 Tax=Cupriavidus oxalaticus TaxID=96344 RepID=A0A375G5I9_9BURK|nr:hypothetical protein CO2235_200081 [Cupriavidus oxalaticus]
MPGCLPIPADTDSLLQTVDQYLLVNRLCQKVDCAAQECAAALSHVAVPSDHNDGQPAPRSDKALLHCKAADGRHPNIQY